MDQLYFIDNSLSNSITVELHLFVWVNVRGSSNFAGSWGRNFVGKWFVALQDMTIHYTLLNLRGDINSGVGVTSEIHER